jgi:hypothetical protein
MARQLFVKAGLAIGVTMCASGAALAGDSNNLLYPLNQGTWTLVDFFGDGPSGSGPAGANQRNDDDSATIASLGFNFNLYGTNYSSLFVNNNGNLSFGSAFSTFTSSGFPVNSFPMVAPFWADVDTRNSASGQVWQRSIDSDGDSDIDTFVVTWDSVGYYNSQADRFNSFQVVISDGSNPRMGLGNNVCFSYGDMNWTTGSASGGVGGFGGTPATVGVNAGNGTDFFQFGRFGVAGNAYDGSGGNVDGIDYLDNLDFCFSVTGFQNQAPIAVGLPEDNKYIVNAGELLNSTFFLIGPELGDIVTITSVIDLDNAAAAGLIITTANGTPASINLTWATDIGDLGLYTFVANYTDSFGLGGSTTFQICVVPAPASGALLGVAGLIAVRRRRN